MTSEEKADKLIEELTEVAKKYDDAMTITIVLMKDERGAVFASTHNFCCPGHVATALSEFVEGIQFAHVAPDHVH